MQGLDGMHERGENERRQTTGEEERRAGRDARGRERERGRRWQADSLARSLARARASGDGKVLGSTFPKRRWRLNLTVPRVIAARDPASLVQGRENRRRFGL